MKALRSAATRLGRQQSLVVLASFVTSLVALTALVPILVRALGTKTYGAWVLTGGIVNYITLLDFGMSLTIARFVALEYKRNRRGAEQAIGVGLGVVTLVGLLAVAVTFPLAASWQGYLGVSGSAFALRVAVCALLLLLLSKVLQSALEGAGKVALSRLIQLAGSLLFTAAAAGTIVFVVSDRLQALSVALLANSALVLAAYWFFLMREWGWNLPVGVPDRAALRRVTAYAATMQGGSIVGFSIDPISRYLLAAAAGPAAVTPLDIAFRTAGQWFGAALAFTRPILPSLGHLTGGEEVVAQRAELLWRRFLEVAVASGGYLALLAYFVFPVLFGDVGHYAGRLAATAVVLWTPSVVAIIPYLYIVLYGRARDVFVIQLATSGVGIALLLGLVWSIGAWAAVLGTGVGSLVGSLLTLRIARRQADQAATFNLSGLSARALAAPVAAGLILLLPLPLAARMPLATLLWTSLCLRQIRQLLDVL